MLVFSNHTGLLGQCMPGFPSSWYACVCMCAYACVYMCMCVCVCLCACVCVCMFVHVCIPVPNLIIFNCSESGEAQQGGQKGQLPLQ